MLEIANTMLSWEGIFLTSAGIDIRFTDGKIQWLNVTVEMKNQREQRNLTHIGQESDKLDDIKHDVFAATILDASMKEQRRNR